MLPLCPGQSGHWCGQQVCGKAQRAGQHRKGAWTTVSNTCLLSFLYTKQWQSSVFKTHNQGTWNLVPFSSGFQPVLLSQAVQTVSWIKRTIWRFDYSPQKFYFAKRRKRVPGRLWVGNKNFDFILWGIKGNWCNVAMKTYCTITLWLRTWFFSPCLGGAGQGHHVAQPQRTLILF